MTLDKWISIAACIAASVSALAALIAVNQASLQRKLSYKPQIIFKPKHFDYQLDYNNPDLTGKVVFRDTDDTHHNKREIALNIGLGAALDVKLKWTYQSTYLVETLNNYLLKAGVERKLRKSEIGIEIINKDNTNYPGYCSDRIEDEIDYILSYSQSSVPQPILIPFSGIALNCALHIYSLQTEQVIHWPAPSLTLEVEYKDIGGEHYKDMYDVWIDMNYIFSDPDKVEMGGQMVFEKKKHRSSTVIGLEKLRRGYAEPKMKEEINYYS
ncbi:hypothetical protein NGC32_12875 [Kluyvera cryocrescens]|uniref:hypothetical protein n=1 Tax=Kluyvera cryocrescens TaxID=580 RepID=UPI002DB949EB|nr:hypothetical protein [Kluyvera cryocrescens]MEB7713613.1 hypothetical protein [Kluyvera cryocrescens]